MPKFALGQSIARLEDDRLLKGAGQYTDDFELKDALHAYVLRSPHAHARIKNILVDKAKSHPGVVAVLTGKDAQADGLGTVACLIPIEGMKEPPRHVLALHEVRHVGDPVALVIAQTLGQAKDAADKIEIDYETLPAVTDTQKGQVAFEIPMGSK